MEVFKVDPVAFWQRKLCLCRLFCCLVYVLRQWLILVVIILNELLVGELKSIRKLNCNLLLFKENEFVIGHVVFGVCFQVRAQFMQIQAILVAATLSIQEELAKL